MMRSVQLRCEANHLAEAMANLANSNQDLYNLSFFICIQLPIGSDGPIFFLRKFRKIRFPWIAWISDSFQGLLAKSLESMLLLWEQHVNAIPDADDSEPASRLRSTANVSWLQLHSQVVWKL